MILDMPDGAFSAFYTERSLRQAIEDSSYTIELNKG